MNVAAWLLATARENGTAPAVVDGTETLWTYRQLLDRCRSAAAVLQRRFGVRPGDRVVVWARNQPDYLVAMYAVWWAGGVVVPVNAKLHRSEVEVIAADADARVLLVDDQPRHGSGQVREAQLSEVADGATFTPEAAPADRTPEDLAWIFYTSGTTGRPKGAMLTHGNLCAASMSYLADITAVDAQRHYLYAAPISHGAGLYAPVHVLAGARHVFPASRGFDAAEVVGLAAELGTLSLFAAPTMVRRMVRAVGDDPGAAGGFHTIVYGGGPMHVADVRRALAAFGPCLVQIYGQGESPMTISALRREQHTHRDEELLDRRLASVGTPHSVVAVRVTDDTGGSTVPGQTGEIEVRGPTVMTGYWGAADATADAIRDGWLRTGDLGSFDTDGYLTLRGRSKEVIISGGSNVYPREVEDVLLRHPSIDEAAVVGLPDPEWGEVVVAVVTAVDGTTVDPSALDAHCLEGLARFKRPRRYVHRRDALPRNAYGKVLRTDLIHELTTQPPQETERP